MPYFLCGCIQEKILSQTFFPISMDSLRYVQKPISLIFCLALFPFLFHDLAATALRHLSRCFVAFAKIQQAKFSS